MANTKTKTTNIKVTVRQIISPQFREAFSKLTLVTFPDDRLSWDLAECVEIIDTAAKRYNTLRNAACEKHGFPLYEIQQSKHVAFLADREDLGAGATWQQLYDLEKKHGQPQPGKFAVPPENDEKLRAEISKLEALEISLPMQSKISLPPGAMKKPKGKEHQALVPMELVTLKDILLPMKRE